LANVMRERGLIYDVESILLFDKVLSSFQLSGFTIKINNNKILRGLAESWDFADKFEQFIRTIDKWDRVGENDVVQELGSDGFTETQIHQVQHLFKLSGTNEEKLKTLDTWFANCETGRKGIAELREVFSLLADTPLKQAELELDLKLARRIDDNNSTIFEVALNEAQVLSLRNGGHYDEWMAAIGLPAAVAVERITLGAERIDDFLKAKDRLKVKNTSK